MLAQPSQRVSFPRPESPVVAQAPIPTGTDFASSGHHVQSAPSIYPSLASSLTLDHPRPMPPHWHNEYPNVRPFLRPFLCKAFQALCLIATGRPNLARVWRALNLADEREYIEATRRMSTMVTASNISSGFLLTSIAALLTTEPPRAAIFDYTLRGPYICLLVSFATSLLSILSGSAVLAGVSRAIREWQVEVAMASRVSIWLSLLGLACPLIFLLLTLMVVGIGMLVAGFESEDTVIRVFSGMSLLIPLFAILALLFVVGQRRHGTGPQHPA